MLFRAILYYLGLAFPIFGVACLSAVYVENMLDSMALASLFALLYAVLYNTFVSRPC